MATAIAAVEHKRMSCGKLALTLVAASRKGECCSQYFSLEFQKMLRDLYSRAFVRPAPGTSASPYHEVLRLFEDVEANMIGVVPSDLPAIAYFQRLILMPPRLIGAGFGAKFQAVALWMCITLMFLLVSAWLTRPEVTLDPKFKEILSWACFATPVFLVLFPMPSIYASSGVAEADVGFAIENLSLRALAAKPRLLFVQQTLKIFEARCSSRIQTLKWVVGITWATWTFLLLKGIDAMLSDKLASVEALWVATGGTVVLVVVYFLASSYEAVLNRVFRSIEIACSVLTLALEEEQQSLKPEEPSN